MWLKQLEFLQVILAEGKNQGANRFLISYDLIDDLLICSQEKRILALMIYTELTSSK